jgi:hypothetical protein
MCLLLSLVDISDIHVFITITRSISLISMCLLLSLGRYLWYSSLYYYHWSISLISMCWLLSLGRYLWYACVYYYHWVDISEMYVFITITGSISLISMCLLLSLGRYLCWWTISPEGIILPVVSVLALTWFIRCISYIDIYSS